jgi:hypothetical protein
MGGMGYLKQRKTPADVEIYGGHAKHTKTTRKECRTGIPACHVRIIAETIFL